MHQDDLECEGGVGQLVLCHNYVRQGCCFGTSYKLCYKRQSRFSL